MIINETSLFFMKNTESTRITFWLLQVIGWSPVFILMLPLFGDEQWTSQFSVLFAITVVLLSVLLSLLLRVLYQAMIMRNVPAYFWAIGIVFSSLIAAIIVGQLHYYLWFLIASVWPNYSPLYISQPIASISLFLTPTFLAWSCLYWLITRQVALTQANQDKELLALRLKEKQLAMLLNQLNPHFMFNTINNIRSLIRVDGERARDMLSAFADIMRYQFTTESAATTRVENELEFVEAYVALHQLQLGQRLNFLLQVEDNYLSEVIPKMAIQLLVENAIKHAFSAQGVVGNLTLMIGALEKDNLTGWHISLMHPGIINQNKNTGIGLSNLRRRLAMYYDNAQLTLTTDGDHVVAKIIIQPK